MKKLVKNSNLVETRIALVEGGTVVELFIERKSEKSLVGNIYKGIVVRVLPGMNAAFVDVGLSRSAFLYGGDVLAPSTKNAKSSSENEDKNLPIDRLLKENQEILVQVAKDSLGTKGPRITMQLAIPGRLLVLSPFTSHIGISRRIEDEALRDSLKEKVESALPPGTGVIIRTAAMSSDSEEFKADLHYLWERWQQVQRLSKTKSAPALLFSESDLIERVARDLYNSEVDEIIIDNKQDYDDLYRFLRDSIGDGANKLTLYDSGKPIFDEYNVEFDIGKALRQRIDMPSGGYLIIDQTEALTSFDVNTGSFVGRVNAEETLYLTNLEAVRYIVEQLRVRDIGGIIIVDFIDMEEPSNRQKVYETLINELKRDRSRTNVLKISDLGLVQMTRKRTTDSLERQLMTVCPICDGRGRVRSVETEALDLCREINRVAWQNATKVVRVKARKDILKWLNTNAEALLSEIIEKFSLEISFEECSLPLDWARFPNYEVFVDNI